MGKKQNVIELNGKRYDAKTGRQIEASSISRSVDVNATKPHNIYDVVKKVARPAKPHPKLPAGRIHQRSRKSSTLARKAVKKPLSSKKGISLKSSKTQNISRANRASAVDQSKLIKHFNTSGISSSIKRTVSLPVKAAPSLHSSVNIPRWPTGSKKVNKLQNSLNASKAHEQPKIKKAKIHHRVAKKLHIKTRSLNIIVSLFVGLGVGGFLAYQNMPGLALRLASARAGIPANLPTYQPAGFSLSVPVGYRSGQVKLGYKSNTDDRSYSITQTASPWDSSSLLQNFIVYNNYKYQTFQDNGKTIYIYNNSNATWVDGGVWYQILGNSVLNSDQLINISNSF